MNKFKIMFAVLVAGILLVSCDKATYKKTPGGMPYQVFGGKDTVTAKIGQYLKIHISQTIKDSVYYSTFDNMPIYVPVRENKIPYDLSEIWGNLHLGDSVVATQAMDTFLKRNPPGSMPPEFKKGDRIITYVKVLGIFTNDSLKSVDENKERDAFAAKEIATVEQFVKAKKVSTQKTPSGVFVEILTPGTGNLIDSGKYVSLDYTGTTFKGVKFDSNIDPAFGHMTPLSFTVGNQEMIKGFDEAMHFLRLGATAKLYVPSLLAYGGNPRGKIKPFENLIFELKVTDVKDQAPPPPPAPAPNMPQVQPAH